MPVLMADSNNGLQIYLSLILNTVFWVGITNCCYLWSEEKAGQSEWFETPNT